jgi:hypothetical protein
MVDAGVIVDVLLVGRHEEAVQRVFPAFTVQDHIDVVARQCPTHCRDMRHKIAAARLLDLQRGDVERARALPLQRAVFSRGILA